MLGLVSQDEVQRLGGIPDEGSVFHRQVNAKTQSYTIGSPPLGFGDVLVRFPRPLFSTYISAKFIALAKYAKIRNPNWLGLAS